MSAPEILRLRPARARALLLAGVVLVGCASPGPPLAPSLHLPEVVSALTAERVGDEVRLRWTTPAKSTDGLAMHGAMTAQVCRRVLRAGSQEACVPVRRTPVRPGASEAVDVLAPALTREHGLVLEYRVEVLNADERSAGSSPGALAAGGPAPPALAGMLAEATEAGARLQWKPEDAGDAVELDRLRVGSAVDAGSKKGQGLGGPVAKEPAEVRLRAAPASGQDAPFRPDAGGTLDPTARRGESYTYTAQRVRRVRVEGHDLELRSVACAPVTVAMRDTFPPRPPVGVEAIAGALGGAMGIDLSWVPNTEEDLAGYLVYRQEVSAVEAVLLTPAPVPQPAFRDAGAVAGHSYRYMVVAVDTAGNQSAPSAAATEEMPRP